VAPDADAEAIGEPVDCPLEPGIVESDQAPAALAHEVVVMAVADPLGARLAIAHLDALDQAVLDQ
jgi:hypothetical protein